ncbi:MAG: RNA polymerase sigma factor [Lawsonibacter sp.]|nr:RNA polymerase sigma factor [Lawsonibacter sp.]
MGNKVWQDQNEFFDSFYCQNFKKMWKLATVILNNPDLAEEAVQDAFLEVFLHIDYLMSVEKPEWWLQKTVKHKSLHILRSQAREASQLVLLRSHDLEDVSAADELLEVETTDDLKHKITHVLKPDELQLLRRIAIDCVSYKEASSELGISIAACQKRIQRIRKKLEKFLLK